MALRILLADDHPLVSAAVADRLHTQTGWEVCGSVTSATALLNSIDSLRPDVVITDYHMPAQGERNSDGLRLLASLRRRHPSMAVIVLTMITNPLVLRSILDTQVHGLVLKDAPLTELVTVVYRIQRGFHYIGKSAMEVLSQADPSSLAGADRLSRREMEVLRLYLTGRSVSEIAIQLCRSVKTISRQKNCAMQKLGVTNDRELFEFAALNGLLLSG
ncbi:response regulator [Cupriavidus taiwanensis]|uniref:Putative Response regulator receiver protein, cheY family n=1 Tax=Cupriavidus taiwanensis TaxID=164546 RepID=A0A375IQ89_9BURK|nr:response regulator [Cupriavidus taiwanensis]SOZ28258.1 putative Response regulator receiver protein, cheY family [Cupriavidus taiwanensis]SOZ71832.1 putative Response regulator receiver protein, cheY family [Cupriavidus taiwanensis]SOZ87134.1 putative Response regulator receiver protein, cheY family [Cupriavidus taiwanensis]SOZ90135.1 putative Response regulator receiver protein, cheY family [Cupriavidus taiwanensis]SOZ94726.1 putative Response regulator receiver protein, cheY family [Cupri